MSAADDRRYPLAPHLLAAWTRGSRAGALELPIGATGRALRIEYVEYRPPHFFPGRHFLGTVTLDGAALRVVERYRYHTISNRGEVRWQGEAVSAAGQCACSELVMAHDARRPLALVAAAPGRWTLGVAVVVDQSFHEIESDDFRCHGELDLTRGELVLERSYFRDAST